MRKYYSLITIFFLLLSFSLAGQDYQTLVNRAAQQIDASRLDSAAISLQRAMRLDPANENNSVLLLNLGIIQRQLKEYDNAFISFTAALPNNPIPDIVLHNRASLLVELGRFDEAMDDYNALINDFPDDVEAYYRRGVLFLEEKDRKSVV